MTGAYLRVKRGASFEAIEVEHLTVEERKQALGNRTPEELLRWLDCTCEKLAELQPLIDGLEADGIIERKARK